MVSTNEDQLLRFRTEPDCYHRKRILTANLTATALDTGDMGDVGDMGGKWLFEKKGPLLLPNRTL
jgi:hypothetical protein